ncbi:hypothetical protein CWO89_34980 [Bradyrhizobium sp. Leo170]|nr:hypothetical protein CWO89_34980 [Bradyrhizobium sp. Leo170]
MDMDIASRALQFGLAPTPLSPWYMQLAARRERRLRADGRRLLGGAIAPMEACRSVSMRSSASTSFAAEKLDWVERQRPDRCMAPVHAWTASGLQAGK